MQNFSKSILNYFAAYNETRFRFTTRVAQKWSNNEYTLDISVFPDFQREIMEQLNRKTGINVSVSKQQYIITLDQDKWRDEVKNLCAVICTKAELDKIREELIKKLPEGEEINQNEIFRFHAIEIRKQIALILLKLQEAKKQELITQLDIQALPISTLNTTSIEQEVFDTLQKLAYSNEEEYLKKVQDYLQDEFKPNLVMYDLYILLNIFNRFIATQTLYIYFHEFILKDDSYPLIALEIDLKPNEDTFSIVSSRDLVLINTPAVNAAKIGSILTTPRACTFEDLEKYVSEMQMYFNGYYKDTDNFILKDTFQKKVGEDLPEIRPRIGFQIVAKEDRKILDYSELITQIKNGAGEKFCNLVQTYVESNVQNTSEEVNERYNQEYPKKSVRNIVSEVPLSLNTNQRKILTAAKNEKNKIMVIDGPPGTGKSHTITALIYLANLLNKKILITSHKPQALDVVEEKLNEQFSHVHPNAKPPILRLTKSGQVTINTLDNTLSSSVISKAIERSTTFNKEIVEKDQQNIEDSLESSVEDVWDKGLEYQHRINDLQKFIEVHQLLSPNSEIPPKNIEVKLDWEKVDSFAKIVAESNLERISFSNLYQLFKNKENIDDWINTCNELYKLDNSQSKPVSLEHEYDISLLLEKLEPLFRAISPEAKLKTILFDGVDIPSIKDKISNIAWNDITKALELTEKLNQVNSGFTKFIGSKEKRELEYTLSLDFPELNEIYKSEGSEKLLFELKAVARKIEESHESYPFLSKDFIALQPFSINELQSAQEVIQSIEYGELFNHIAESQKVTLSEMTIGEVQNLILSLHSNLKYNKLIVKLENPASILGLNTEGVKNLHSVLVTANQLIQKTNIDTLRNIELLVNHYPDQWRYIEVVPEDIRSVTTIANHPEKYDQIKTYILLHQQLSSDNAPDMDFSLVKKYVEKSQRLLEFENQKRFAGLKDHMGDVQRILNTVASKKRLTHEQSKVLFEKIPCIIAPPDLISEYFPMEADMIDWLIIDEASQVSIAESLSLILRAKQTMVFGDELQYGAVGATNVSLEYSKQYFRNVLDDYVKDKQDYNFSEEEREKIASEVSQNVPEDEMEVNAPEFYKVNPATKEWLKTFNIRTSTLDFARALANYSDSLTVHFRSFPEIIGYSNKFFYKPSEINLVTSRIRTKPITEVLQFIKVDTKGLAGERINLDEIEAIKQELQKLFDSGYKGSIGIICSFQEQTARMNQILRKDLRCFGKLVENNGLKIWFVGEVQGEERDVIFYSFVADKSIGNANLSTIYPVLGGTADNIRNLRMQRLNVGFSRAKDKMVFVHSMDLKEYKDTRLGDALEFYFHTLKETHDHYIEDTSIFDSPAEQELYSLITQTDFYHKYKKHLHLVAQFEIGKYIKEEFRSSIPQYRVDFLLTYSQNGKEHSLIIEYDGLEYHTKNPYNVNSATTFDQEYLEYDIQRQLELKSYGYEFLRINKFTLVPSTTSETKVDVLNQLLYKKFLSYLDTTIYDSPTTGNAAVRDASAVQYDSKQETSLKSKIIATDFYKNNIDKITLVPQYQVGEYIRQTFKKFIPSYRSDFLLVYRETDKDQKLLIEYDGENYHDEEYDNKREEEIKPFGFKFLRINKHTFIQDNEKSEIDQLNDLLVNNFSHNQ